MLWNWYTLDACFLTSSWHITSHGMFAGSCIAIIALVCTLEFLHRMGRRYDRYLLREHQMHQQAAPVSSSSKSSRNENAKSSVSLMTKPELGNSSKPMTFRPNALQQMVRTLLHVLQFALAYVIMLLAMYYNGYVIICIFIGAFVGFFLFEWERITLEGTRDDAVVCCG